jgi:hypothetical protein
MTISLLFPTGKERQWQTFRASDGKKSTETVRVDSPRKIGNIENATTLTMYQNGKPYRSEMFQVKKDSIALVAAGGVDKMVMNPPMVLLRAKSPGGREYKWEGRSRSKAPKLRRRRSARSGGAKTSLPPPGSSRRTASTRRSRPSSTGRPVTFPASRWFYPGVGIVKQTFRVGNSVVEKELVSYTAG